jgi:diaminopimelate epimerase
MNQDQANVALAKLNLEYTTVYAPFDGLLGEHMVDVGNMVGANAAMPTAVVTIEQIDPIYVNFSINTRDALRLRRMMEAAGMAIKSGVNTAPVLAQGPLIEHHGAFPKRVNAGFMQVLSRSEVRLRVFERGAGETLACGTGACAAVVAGIQRGLLDSSVRVQTRGGKLRIHWSGQSVTMTGPAVTVFHGEIELDEPR